MNTTNILRTAVAALVMSLPVGAIAQKAKPKTKATTQKSKTVAKTIAADNKSNQPFQLSIAAHGYKDSTMATIFSMSNQQFRGPNGIVKSEKVFLDGSLPETDGYALVFTDKSNQNDQRVYPLFLSNSVYQIEVDHQVANSTKVISGDAQTKAFADIIPQIGPGFEELQKLSFLEQQYQQMGKPADSILMRKEQVTASMNKPITDFIGKQPSLPVSAFVIKLTQQVMSPDQLQRNVAMLKGEAASDPYIRQLIAQAEAEKMFSKGQPAPDFTQNDTLGKPVALSSFKGKYVLLDFWASWCGPCRMENPNVVNAYNQYKDKNFTVLSVSLDKDRERWIQAIHADNLAWTHVSDLQYWSNAVAQQYKIQSIPQNLLIGPDGKIIAKNLRGGVLDAYLKDLLK